MTLTRVHALVIALGLAAVGIAAAKTVGSDLRNGLTAPPAAMEPRALARGDIVLIEPDAVPKRTRRS